MKTFTFTFSCGKDNKEFCVHGKWTEGIDVVLFSQSGQKTCQGKVGNSFLYENEMFSFEATKLTDVANCDPSLPYEFAAFRTTLSDVRSFGSVSLVKVESKDVQLKMTEVIAKENYLEKVLKATVETTVYKTTDFTSGPIKILSLPQSNDLKDGKSEIYFLHYGFQKSETGPIISYVDGQLTSLAEVCSGEKGIVAYEINKELFLVTIHACCACDANAFAIYKLEDKQFKFIEKNSDWSL